jgi:hypothetical protein
VLGAAALGIPICREWFHKSINSSTRLYDEAFSKAWNLVVYPSAAGNSIGLKTR